jgi:hypothetical protein
MSIFFFYLKKKPFISFYIMIKKLFSATLYVIKRRTNPPIEEYYIKTKPSLCLLFYSFILEKKNLLHTQTLPQTSIDRTLDWPKSLKQVSIGEFIEAIVNKDNI